MVSPNFHLTIYTWPGREGQGEGQGGRGEEGVGGHGCCVGSASYSSSPCLPFKLQAVLTESLAVIRQPVNSITRHTEALLTAQGLSLQLLVRTKQTCIRVFEPTPRLKLT